MDCARRQENMDARMGGVLERFPRAVDVLLIAAGKPADADAADEFGDFANRLKIAGRGDRKAGFDHIDADVDEGLGDFELFAQVHARARGLLAVAERGVEDDDAALVWCGHESGGC